MQGIVTAFRAVMPTASGVVVADARGRALAHDLRPGIDPQGLVDAAHRTGAGALVEREEGLFFVVFLPDDAAERRPPAAVAAA